MNSTKRKRSKSRRKSHSKEKLWKKVTGRAETTNISYSYPTSTGSSGINAQVITAALTYGSRFPAMSRAYAFARVNAFRLRFQYLSAPASDDNIVSVTVGFLPRNFSIASTAPSTTFTEDDVSQLPGSLIPARNQPNIGRWVRWYADTNIYPTALLNDSATLCGYIVLLFNDAAALEDVNIGTLYIDFNITFIGPTLNDASYK